MLMQLQLDLISDMPGFYQLVSLPGRGTPAVFSSFFEEIRDQLAERGIETNGCNFEIIRLTDDQAFESRMRWG